MFAPTPVTDSFFWFVMRDLKRPNAKQPAYRFLADQGLEVFTPMIWHLALRKGKRVREERPFLPDLLFVHCTRPLLDPLVELVPTLQYRYIRGAYELTSAHYGRMVRIVGGPLDGCEGRLLSVRGSRVKRLLVDIPNLLTAGVEVQPEYIQVL